MNEVNVEALDETIRAFATTPTLGFARFRAKNRWMGQALKETALGDFLCAGEEHSHQTRLVLGSDEAPVLLGKDGAGSLVESILHALAGWVTTTKVYHAAARGIQIDEIETTLERDLDLPGLLETDPSVPCGYQNIRVSRKITSDAPPVKLEEL